MKREGKKRLLALLLAGAMAYAARRTAEQTARALSSGGGRVRENRGGSQSVTRTDPGKLTSQELADIRDRVYRGEKIRF